MGYGRIKRLLVTPYQFSIKHTRSYGTTCMGTHILCLSLCLTAIRPEAEAATNYSYS